MPAHKRQVEPALSDGRSPVPQLAGVRHRYVEVAGVRFHVATAGRGEPLVMLHGWPQNWFMWRHLLKPMGKRYHLICPDLRGFGWSDAPSGGYTKERMATDVLGLLDQLGVDRFRLMGHDWGGLVGYLIALREPRRVQRLMVLNMIHPWPSPLAMVFNASRSLYMLANAVGLGGWEMRVHRGRFIARLRHTLVRQEAMSDADLKIFLDPLSDAGRAHSTRKVYRDFLTREALAFGFGRYKTRRLTVPTMVLFGEDDAAISPRMLGGYESHTDDLRLEMIPGCGHFIAEEQPDLVARRALAFFGAPDTLE